MQTDSAFLFIESNTSGTGVLFAETARSLGHEPYLLAADPVRYSYPQGSVTFVQTDTSDQDAICRAVNTILDQRRVAGVASSSEYWQSAAAGIALRLGLPCANPEALARSRNKNWQRTRFAAAGLITPTHARAQSMQDLEHGLATVSLPVVIKPAQGSGSMGVMLCRSNDEALRHGRDLLEQSHNERGTVVTPELILEEYIDGPEFSAEIFGRQLVGVTRKHLSAEPYFLEVGHDFPAALEDDMLLNIEIVCLQALEALGLTWGPSHVEFRLTPEGPVIIEVNARLAGGFIPSLVERATGIDLIRQTLLLHSGAETCLQPAFQHAASIRFLVCTRPGIFERISIAGQNQAAGDVNVVQYASGPKWMPVSHDFRDRLGHVIASGYCPSEASEKAERRLLQIELVMKNTGPRGE